jgi:large subunit ribosomal protein L13
MQTNSYRTQSTRPADVERSWFIVDAENMVVGRMASKVAAILRGKHKPTFTPHVDTGDFVVIINAEKVRFTGAKETDKLYFRHTGYPGGVKQTPPKDVREKKPTFIVETAIRGMLPKGALGRQMFKKLKVYAGTEHPHEAQQPEPLAI